MATLMEKDVLLEYASFGWLIKDDTQESEKALQAMGELWNEILMTEPKNLDYQAMIEKIKTLRSKYE